MKELLNESLNLFHPTAPTFLLTTAASAIIDRRYKINPQRRQAISTKVTDNKCHKQRRKDIFINKLFPVGKPSEESRKLTKLSGEACLPLISAHPKPFNSMYAGRWELSLFRVRQSPRRQSTAKHHSNRRTGHETGRISSISSAVRRLL